MFAAGGVDHSNPLDRHPMPIPHEARRGNCATLLPSSPSPWPSAAAFSMASCLMARSLKALGQLTPHLQLTPQSVSSRLNRRHDLLGLRSLKLAELLKQATLLCLQLEQTRAVGRHLVPQRVQLVRAEGVPEGEAQVCR